MILVVSYGKASVYYEDRAPKGSTPTPEHVEDTLRRMERTLARVWDGKDPDVVVMPEVDEAEQE